MRATGENYLAALHALEPQTIESSSDRTRELIEMLADPALANGAQHSLAQLPHDERRAAGMRGLKHEHFGW
jgi:hypothetical protein